MNINRNNENLSILAPNITFSDNATICAKSD